MKIIFFALLLLSIPEAFSNNALWNILKKRKPPLTSYPFLIGKLVEQDLYYSAVPYIKEYLFKVRRPDSRIDRLIDRVATKVGVRQFELLPERVLRKSSMPTFKYILAKRLFRKKRYARVTSLMSSFRSKGHPLHPFALHLKGSSQVLSKHYASSRRSFEECIEVSEKGLNTTYDRDRTRQLEINKDSCRIGIARSYFNEKKYDQGSEAFFKIPRQSPLWPEILFEEAWTSFYTKNYNKTLGKLTTYQAPILDFIFNPAIDELKALTYFKMCLYEDTKKIVNDFYVKYEQDARKLDLLFKKE